MTREEMEGLAVAVVTVLETMVQREVHDAVRVLERAFPLIPALEDRVYFTSMVAGMVLAMLREVDVLGAMHVTVIADAPERVQ